MYNNNENYLVSNINSDLYYGIEPNHMNGSFNYNNINTMIGIHSVINNQPSAADGDPNINAKERVSRSKQHLHGRCTLCLHNVKTVDLTCYCSTFSTTINEIRILPHVGKIVLDSQSTHIRVIPKVRLITHDIYLNGIRKIVGHSFIIGNFLFSTLPALKQEFGNIIESIADGDVYLIGLGQSRSLFKREIYIRKLIDYDYEGCIFNGIKEGGDIFIYSSIYEGSLERQILIAISPINNQYYIPGYLRPFMSHLFGSPILNHSGDLLGVVRRDLSLDVFSMNKPNDYFKIVHTLNQVM